mgnify:FL=1|tara:strand:+ start:788 stop:1195 length:408 start_codon:yes stop_codon:yes gene_type:complete
MNKKLCGSCYDAVESEFGVSGSGSGDILSAAAFELGEEISDHICDAYDSIVENYNGFSLDLSNLSEKCSCSCFRKKIKIFLNKLSQENKLQSKNLAAQQKTNKNSSKNKGFKIFSNGSHNGSIKPLLNDDLSGYK